MLDQRLHVSLMIHQQKHIKSLRKKEQEGVPAVAQGCGTGTPAVSLEFWDTGLTPRLAQWIGDLVFSPCSVFIFSLGNTIIFHSVNS